jgi:hypothetical protein
LLLLDTGFGVESKKMPINTRMGLSKLAAIAPPSYASDDGSLTLKQILALQEDATKRLPKGKLLSRNELFA